MKTIVRIFLLRVAEKCVQALNSLSTWSPREYYSLNVDEVVEEHWEDIEFV
jgi:hypothetical protein